MTLQQHAAARSKSTSRTVSWAALPGQPTWVLLRGMSRESGHWGRFPQALGRFLQTAQPGSGMRMLDLPGMGERRGDTSPTRVSAIVEECRAQLAAAGVRGPVYLVGMSLGAMVATDWIAHHPAEVAGGVLINASVRPFSERFRMVRPMSYVTLMLLSLSRFSARPREARVLRLTTRLVEREAVLDHWVALARERPLGVRNSFRQLYAAWRYRASRTRPGAPILLLCSKGDTLVDWRCSQAMSRAWGAPLRLHTQAGHDLPLDDPEWVAGAITDWLAERQRHGLDSGFG